MRKIIIVDQHKNPGLLRFTETKAFFDKDNQGIRWFDDSIIDDVTHNGIIINSGEIVTPEFKEKYYNTTGWIDARGDSTLLRFDPTYSYNMRDRPPYAQGTKQYEYITNLFRMIVKSRKLVYLDNTEEVREFITDSKHFYGLASGWKSVQMIRNFGINYFDTITVYDFCDRQLAHQKYLHSLPELPKTLEVEQPTYGEYNPPKELIKFWPKWHNTKVNFVKLNLFETPTFPDNSLVWVSNAFSYEPTIFEFGWEECKRAKERLISTNKSSIIIET